MQNPGATASAGSSFQIQNKISSEQKTATQMLRLCPNLNIFELFAKQQADKGTG